jgi:hypothetical protein
MQLEKSLDGSNDWVSIQETSTFPTQVQDEMQDVFEKLLLGRGSCFNSHPGTKA